MRWLRAGLRVDRGQQTGQCLIVVLYRFVLPQMNSRALTSANLVLVNDVVPLGVYECPEDFRARFRLVKLIPRVGDCHLPLTLTFESTLASTHVAHRAQQHNNCNPSPAPDATLNDAVNFVDRTPTVFQNFSSCSRHPDKPLYIRN